MKRNLIGGFLEAESVIGGRPCQSRRAGATDEHSSISRFAYKIIWIKSYSDFPTPAYLQNARGCKHLADKC